VVYHQGRANLDKFRWRSHELAFALAAELRPLDLAHFALEVPFVAVNLEKSLREARASVIDF
jgi:hypothetical protein